MLGLVLQPSGALQPFCVWPKLFTHVDLLLSSLHEFNKESINLEKFIKNSQIFSKKCTLQKKVR